MRYIFFIVLFVSFTAVSAQSNVRWISILPYKGYVHLEGFEYQENTAVSKEYFKNDIKLTASDKFPITDFQIVYKCVGCEPVRKTFGGSKLKKGNWKKILNNLQKGDVLTFEAIRLSKYGNYYQAPKFNIIITD